MRRKPAMTAAVLYARISPRPEENESVEHQLHQLRAACLSRGLVVLGDYQDVLRSGGTLRHRDGLQAAMDLACREKALLAVYTLSRFARNLRDAIHLYERLDAAGATLWALAGFQVDTSTPQGRLMFHFALALDQYFREELAARTSAAMLHYQEQGRRMGSRPRYGWRLDEEGPKHKKSGLPCRLVPDSRGQAAIARMGELRGDGLSYRAIARLIREEGFPPCCHETVKAVLRRESGSLLM